MWISWVFLGLALVGALFTLNALHPIRVHWSLLPTGFFGSWLVGELIPHHLFWQAAATALFWWAGAFAHWPGWMGLAITLVSWTGMVFLLVQAMRAKPAMEAALREGLGPDYRSEIDADLARHLDDRSSLRQRVLPLPMWDRRVERVRDVPFAHANGRDLKLDVYRRRDHPTGCPTLLQVHGGAWMIGTKNEQGIPLMLRLAAHGWVCIAIDYRLSPWATWPEHEIDVKAAIRWIRTHAEEYGADPTFVVVTGGSAGGHLSALTALTAGDPEYQPGFEGVDTRVVAAVPLYGVYDLTDETGVWRGLPMVQLLERHVMKESFDEHPELFERASPVNRAGIDAPPFLVIHGTNDILAPIVQARDFVNALRAVSQQPVCYAELPYAQHAFEIFPSLRTSHVIRGVERFLAWVCSRERRRRAAIAEAAQEKADEAGGQGSRASSRTAGGGPSRTARSTSK